MKYYKKLMYVFVLLLCGLLTTGCWFNNFNSKKNNGKDYTIKPEENESTFLELSFSVNNYDIGTTTIDGVTYSTIDFNGGVRTDKLGYASLPILQTAVKIPSNKNISNEIVNEDYIDISLDYPLLPSKGVIYRNQNPSEIRYEIAPESYNADWYPQETIQMSDPYIFRDVRGMNIYANPFKYNATTKTLRIYKSITVDFLENDSGATNSLPRKSVADIQIAPEMNAIYQSVFINYDSPGTRAVNESGELLVIYTSRDASVIQPYIQWKREKGIKVSAMEVATGTNVKSVIQNAYNANQNLLYVQLVGDWEDIKSDIGTGQSKPMDPRLGCVIGSDTIPDLIIGRFSAKNTTDVTTQINKAINYEKNPDLNATWYSNALGLGSSEGPGDDNEKDFEHINVINNIKLPAFTYTASSTTEYSDNNNTSQVANVLNTTGASVISYCGHGGEQGWGTTGFSNSNVNSLSNGSKLPIIFSVACAVGNFSSSVDCFAEAWLKKQNGGAVAVVMSTINQSWEPPMRGEDYMADLLVGGWNYSTHAGSGSGTNTTSGRTTFGSIVLNGAILMDDEETLSTWTVFGDSSLQVRTVKPKLINLSNQTVMVNTPFTTMVTSGGVGQSATVTLSQSGNFYSAQTDASGTASISHNLAVGQALLVVTGQNLETKYNTVNVTGGTFTINASAGANGSISPSGSVEVNQGASQGFTITPAAGYSIDALTVDGANAGTVTSYTFSNVQADHNISVVFKANSSGGPAGYTWCANEGGSFTLPGTCDVAYGANGTFVYLYGKTGTITFNPDTFGSDPVPNVVKAGYYKQINTENMLEFNVWVANSIAAQETKWFYFNAIYGQQYRITWDDAYEGSGTYNGNDIVVSGYRPDKTTAYFSDVDSGYNSPIVINAVATEKVYIKVRGYDVNQAANYSLKVISSEPAGYTWCAIENGSYTLPGTCDVAYGANGTFNFLYGKTGTITFNNATFGDPVPGVVKSGYYKVNSEIQINLDQWVANSITANQTKWFYFNATAGQQYSISWDDAYEGSGTYNGNDIVVSGYRPDKTTAYFSDVDSGYTTPKVINAGATEKVYIKVRGYDTSQPANYSLKVTSSKSPIQTVAFKALINSQYVCAENSGDLPLIANRTAVGLWETFDLINNIDGTVSLKAQANGKYVSADNGGSSPLIANKSTITGDTEKFYLITNSNGNVSLKLKANGMYVCAESAGTSSLIANRTAIGTWEQFILEDK